METETVFLFSDFPSAWGSFTSMVFNCLAKVEAIIKKINNRKTTSVIDDILNSGLILFLPLSCMLMPVRSRGLKILGWWLPFDIPLYLFLPLSGCK